MMPTRLGEAVRAVRYGGFAGERATALGLSCRRPVATALARRTPEGEDVQR